MKKRIIALLLFSVIALLGLGLMVLASASSCISERLYADPRVMFRKQIVWAVCGIVTAFLVQRSDYHYFKNFMAVDIRLGAKRLEKVPLLTIALYMAVLLALAFVFVPGVGIRINGSSCWVNLGWIHFKPGAFSAVALTVVMSVWLDRIAARTGEFAAGTLCSLAIVAPIAALTMLQPDIMAAAALCLLAGVLLFVAGVNLRYLILLAFTGGTALAFAMLSRADRLLSIRPWFFEPGAASEPGYQLSASLLAIQRGGLGGVGYNESLQKFFYLPESHSDFIFAIGAEELGLIFSLAVVALFVAVLICGVIISYHAPDRLGRYLGGGLTLSLVVPALFNLAVVTGLAPTQGTALPFFSYGGASLFAAMVAVGMLINVARQMERGGAEAHLPQKATPSATGEDGTF